MRLIKKWENKTVYKTSRGTVVAHHEENLAVVHVEDRLLARYLQIVHKFKRQEIEKEVVKKEVAKNKSVKKEVKKASKPKKKATSKRP